MQLAFARVKESWDDAILVSVHGRPIEAIIEQVKSSPKVGIFTDDEHTPGEIAKVFMGHGLKGYQAFVCENLGGEDERVTETLLEKLPEMEFSALNVLILKKIGENQQPGSQGGPRPAHTQYTFGIPEDEFECMKPRRGLITKTEVRVISLSKMALQKDSVVWDIGAGSGSVSIESALLAPEGLVYAIEKDEEDVGIIHRNLAKFETWNVCVIHGRAPEALVNLEQPDAVFVGGSSGKLQGILEICLEKLKPAGRLVVNLATIENLSEAYEFFKQRGIRMDVSQIQVSRGSPILNLTRFEAFNPVFVIAVRKEGDVKDPV
jgi:precorrin-6Y C5,15-methyltransferase (decarboxylating)